MSSNNTHKTNIDYFSKHIFLNYCSKCLYDIIKYADKKKLSQQALHIKSDILKKEFQNKYIDFSEEEKYNWLANNGCKSDLYAFYYKHLFFSLLIDFSNYYNASIEMAYKGNINVAWAILRKPLQETLAYIEWLYVDKEELVKLMLDKNNIEYEIMSKKLKEKRKEHIQKIQSYEEAQIIDMFDFRYSYDSEFTINGILQACNHLITSRPALKTTNGGMNFVFSNDETLKRNTGFYYTTVPYIMQYVMRIVFNIFFDIAKFSDTLQTMNLLNLYLKNLEAIPTSFEEAKEILSLDIISIICPKCYSEFSKDEDWIAWVNNRFKCKKCQNKINTYGLISKYHTQKNSFTKKGKNNG